MRIVLRSGDDLALLVRVRRCAVVWIIGNDIIEPNLAGLGALGLVIDELESKSIQAESAVFPEISEYGLSVSLMPAKSGTIFLRIELHAAFLIGNLIIFRLVPAEVANWALIVSIALS